MKTKRVTVSNPTKRRAGDIMSEIRESIGLSQEDAGKNVGKSQQTISRWEQQETFTEEEFEQVLNTLGVTREYFEKWKGNSGSMIVHHIQDHGRAFNNNHCTNHFDPVEKVIELVDKLEKVHQENKSLNAEIIKVEREKNALLQSTIDTLKKLLDRFGKDE